MADTKRTETADQPFDPRHPAASAFAVAQPGAGVVSDDADEKGQNLAGGPTASEASVTFSDQREVLQRNYERDLARATGQDPDAGDSEDDVADAKPEPKADGSAKAAAAKKTEAAK